MSLFTLAATCRNKLPSSCRPGCLQCVDQNPGKRTIAGPYPIEGDLVRAGRIQDDRVAAADLNPLNAAGHGGRARGKREIGKRIVPAGVEDQHLHALRAAQCVLDLVHADGRVFQTVHPVDDGVGWDEIVDVLELDSMARVEEQRHLGAACRVLELTQGIFEAGQGQVRRCNHIESESLQSHGHIAGVVLRIGKEKMGILVGRITDHQCHARASRSRSHANCHEHQAEQRSHDGEPSRHLQQPPRKYAAPSGANALKIT